MVNLGAGNYNIPKPLNEPVCQYLPGSAERLTLKAELERQSRELVSIPLIINGEKIHTEKRISVVMPHNHKHILAYCSQAGEKELKWAIASALSAKSKWENMP